ncbi:hypothetical protein H5410_001229 [Solanum commersonii]|uniref:Uncharacterized protein n=1 Tax=Solanum commersonii TaxID=4109 RepID=A0A9J6AYF2_SOLCO|nr:hypothetical protein H5410_001229 [Solanum commersonii]
MYRFPKMKRLFSNCPELVSELESYILKLHYRRVCWEFPVDNELNVTQMVYQEVIQVKVLLLWCLEMMLVILCVLLPVQTNMYSKIMEGNVVADSLANYAIIEQISGTFEEFHHLSA